MEYKKTEIPQHLVHKAYCSSGSNTKDLLKIIFPFLNYRVRLVEYDNVSYESYRDEDKTKVRKYFYNYKSKAIMSFIIPESKVIGSRGVKIKDVPVEFIDKVGFFKKDI